MSRKKPSLIGSGSIDMASYWFVELERGRKENRPEVVDEATRELRRLGYAVTLVEAAPC